jgi:transposase-like protein
MNQRIAPSQRIEQQMNEFLQGGISSSEEPLSQFIRLAVQKMVQAALEQEVTDYLGRERYERKPEVKGYRNGYKPGHIRSAEGDIRFEVPQMRDTSEAYQSKLLAFLRGNSDVLEYLVTQMYSRGLSTRDVEDAFRDPYSGELLLSRTAVSEITDSLWEDYQHFCQRDLSDFDVEYLFLDAVYESLRRQGNIKEALLCAWGICRDGRKVLLHLALGNKESTSAWRQFVRDMQQRGLPLPVLIASDGAPAVIAVIEELYPNSLRQRCTMHKTRNILDKVPQAQQPEVKCSVRAIWNAPNRDTADLLVQDFIARYGHDLPSATACLQDDLEACLSFLRCPAHHHKRIRTTNLIERAFAEQRRRTKVIPRFWDERSCLKLVFATLMQTSERWQNVRMSDIEVAMLEQLRSELGLEPPVNPSGWSAPQDKAA